MVLLYAFEDHMIGKISFLDSAISVDSGLYCVSEKLVGYQLYLHNQVNSKLYTASKLCCTKGSI